MGDREELIEVWKIMEDENSTEREKFLAEQKEKWILDKRAIYAAGYDKGYKEGLELGRKAVYDKEYQKGLELGRKAVYDKEYQKGLELGRKEIDIKVAKKLKEQGAETSLIEKVTELTKEEIEKL